MSLMCMRLPGVSYAFKGNVTHKEEVQMSKALVQSYVETTNDKNDMSRMVSQIINKISSSSLISSMVSEAQSSKLHTPRASLPKMVT